MSLVLLFEEGLEMTVKAKINAFFSVMQLLTAVYLTSSTVF